MIALFLKLFVAVEIRAQDKRGGDPDLWVPSYGVQLNISLAIVDVSDIRASSMVSSVLRE